MSAPLTHGRSCVRSRWVLASGQSLLVLLVLLVLLLLLLLLLLRGRFTV